MYAKSEDPSRETLLFLTHNQRDCSGLSIGRIQFSSQTKPADLASFDFSNSMVSSSSFSCARLADSIFCNSIMDAVDFSYATLANCSFRDCLLNEVDLRGTELAGADFKGVDLSSTVLVERDGVVTRLQGQELLGYIQFYGGRTDDVPQFFVFYNHPKFPIMEKICRKLAEQSIRQRLGLEQKGVAQQDPVFARQLLAFVEKTGWIKSVKARSGLVQVTPSGREAFMQLADAQQLPRELADFLKGVSR